MSDVITWKEIHAEFMSRLIDPTALSLVFRRPEGDMYARTSAVGETVGVVPDDQLTQLPTSLHQLTEPWSVGLPIVGDPVFAILDKDWNETFAGEATGDAIGWLHPFDVGAMISAGFTASKDLLTWSNRINQEWRGFYQGRARMVRMNAGGNVLVVQEDIQVINGMRRRHDGIEVEYLSDDDVAELQRAARGEEEE